MRKNTKSPVEEGEFAGSASFLEIARDTNVAESNARSTFVFRQRSRVVSFEGAPDGGMYDHKANRSQQQTTRALADTWR